MHIGSTNASSYSMLDLSDHKLKESKFIEKEEDLGVTFDNNLKFSSHIIYQVNKANQLMGLIRRSCTFLDKNSFCYLFKPLIRPHLEYCVSIWYPLLKKDEELIENVLRRASKLIPKFSYPDHLRAIDIPNMKYCRIRGDMIQVYKILQGDDESLKVLFNVDSTSITRGNKFKLKKPFVKNKVLKYFFSTRVITDWNSLPPFVVNAVSLDSFKTKLYKIWSDKKYEF